MKAAILRRRPPPLQFGCRCRACGALIRARTRVVLDQFMLEHHQRHTEEALKANTAENTGQLELFLRTRLEVSTHFDIRGGGSR